MSVGKVLVLRGLPGSGKSTFVEKLPKYSHHYTVVSADHFFTRTGSYVFDPKKLGEAHAECFRYALKVLQGPECYNVLVVDNTNISSWEPSPYVQAAAAFGVECEIVTLWCDPVVAAQRNVHKVPLPVILRMYNRLLNEELPAHWKQRIEIST